ncbi:V-type ATP synthase subunit F [Sediminispirochaeta smaragdinae]|uniref:Vacuolar H+transporting two-sector ATPase F subunit n=1 Tax=Sediminispirochaeta smaragdinae (strain DSM 11293 / JCM 15392 / SEBR 4228) TaxID=573413 RepID=E1R4X0_SEDSS|nr:V-type ATP synthase subunit F [Sediminispirochaeta smaragdinae]ADK82208.1 Vacuolar H+transporting two-sector ATPase F subunit [Sediminispirochaeta smaragdinae DSM 11293]
MDYFVIGDEDTILGFGMVGVRGRSVEDAVSANAALSEALDDKEIGIIIITETAAETIRDRVNGLTFSHRFPLIVEIPDRNGPSPGRKSLRELVNQAIGIKL